MPFPPPETTKPAIIKAAEDTSLQVPSSVLERREQRLLRGAFNELLQKSEQVYSNERAFRGSEEQLALSLTFLLSTTQDGARVPNSRLDVVEKFSHLSRDEILKKALQQDAFEEAAKLETQRDKISGKDEISQLVDTIETSEEELQPQRQERQQLLRSIERILTDPGVAKELKTQEERLAAVADLQKRLTLLSDRICDDECLLAMRKHELLEATELSKELTVKKRHLLEPLDAKIKAARERGRGTEGLSIRDLIRPEQTKEFLRSYAKSETAALSIREARTKDGEISVASFGFDSPILGQSTRRVFLFDKTGIELSYKNGSPQYVEHGAPHVIIQEPDFSKFETPSSQTTPQGELALITRPATAEEQKKASLGRDEIHIHAAHGALITVGELRYLSVRVSGSPIIDMSSARSEDDTMLNVALDKGTGTAPLILRYNRIPTLSVREPLFRNTVSLSLSQKQITLEGTHSLPIELHIQTSKNHTIKIPVSRPGAENKEFNSERATRARIQAALE